MRNLSRTNRWLGVNSHKRNQERVKHSHEQDTSHDRRKSKRRVFRFHENKAAQEGWYRRDDSYPVCRHPFFRKIDI